MTRFRLLPLAALALACLAGCAAETASRADGTTASGTAESRVAEHRLSGTLRMTGGPVGVDQPGVPGEVVFTDGKHRSEAKAGPDGAFSVTLPAGTYTLTGTSPLYGDGRARCHADRPVALDRAVTDVEVSCPRR